jgi:hypothetical protein
MEEINLNNMINVSDFLLEIERIASDKNIDYIDAIVHYCSKNGMEIETAADLIKKNAKIKAKVKLDAETIGYLPKTAKLPI